MNVAFRRTSGALLISPSELGPTSRSPASRTMSSSLGSSQDDASMSCAGPAGTTSNAFAPVAAAAAAKSRTAASSTARMTRSGATSSSPRLRKDRPADATAPPGSTHSTTPQKPPLRMFSTNARPTFPGVSAAPMTATDEGARIGRSEASAAKWSRSSIRWTTASTGVMSTDTLSSSRPARLTAKPAFRNTLSITRFTDSTAASKRRTPRSAPIAASCSSIRVPIPRRCSSSVTANAISATPGSRSPW